MQFVGLNFASVNNWNLIPGIMQYTVKINHLKSMAKCMSVVTSKCYQSCPEPLKYSWVLTNEVITYEQGII